MATLRDVDTEASANTLALRLAQVKAATLAEMESKTFGKTMIDVKALRHTLPDTLLEVVAETIVDTLTCVQCRETGQNRELTQMSTHQGKLKLRPSSIQACTFPQLQSNSFPDTLTRYQW